MITDLYTVGPLVYRRTVDTDDTPWDGDEPLGDDHGLYFVGVEIYCETDQQWVEPSLVGRAGVGCVALNLDDPLADSYLDTLTTELVTEAEDDIRALVRALGDVAISFLR